MAVAALPLGSLVVVATLLRLAEDATSGTEPMLALLLPSAISSAGGLDWIDDTPRSERASSMSSTSIRQRGVRL